MTSAQVLFDFEGRKAEELSLTKGEELTAIVHMSADWWKGTNARGQRGLFPAKYVVEIDPNKVLRYVLATHAFVANKPERISFAKGESIAVLAEVSPEWWTGRNAAGQTGLFPSNYVCATSAPKPKKSAPKAPVAKTEGFTSATLQNFPIKFAMPSQVLPSLSIGSKDTAEQRKQRETAKRLLKDKEQHM